jgi:peptidoglycan hydrolase-like protein with peptidoglycan-binding domain
MSTYLQHGSEGDLVAALQEALNEQGYDLAVDGIFGEGTDAAVRDFQAESDLDVDGIVGPDTLAALGLEEVAASHGKRRQANVVYLEHGNTGSAVRTLQHALVAAGYELDVDGVFGANTDATVRDFQRQNDLDADGVVGPNTWAALQQYMG